MRQKENATRPLIAKRLTMQCFHSLTSYLLLLCRTLYNVSAIKCLGSIYKLIHSLSRHQVYTNTAHCVPTTSLYLMRFWSWHLFWLAAANSFFFFFCSSIVVTFLAPFTSCADENLGFVRRYTHCFDVPISVTNVGRLTPAAAGKLNNRCYGNTQELSCYWS